MVDKAFLQRTADYFHSDHWNALMELLRQQNEDMYHIHTYVDTMLNPWTLEQILIAYFRKTGFPIYRKTEIFTSGQIAGSGTIHGFEPHGMAHFDMLFRYADDAPIKPTVNDEPNLQYWDKAYMDKFHAQFPFKTEVTAAEQKEIDAYFSGKAWGDYCRLNESDDVVHIHANVETSVHPEIIRKNALAAMAKRGWDIELSVPVAFKMRGLMHGKVVFAGKKPEKMFDIAWVNNPTVTLHPSTRYCLTTDNPTYDARTMREMPNLLQRNNYVLLSLAEMEEVANLI